MTQATSFPTRGKASRIAAVLAIVALAGCDATAARVPSDGVADLESLAMRPYGATPDTCWYKTVTPAVVQSASEKILITPADVSPEGLIRAPAQYRTQARQQIVTPRRVTWHETLCPHELTPELVANLQRALAARGAPIQAPNGTYDTATRAAVRAYQAPAGYDTDALTVDSARGLGLIPVDRNRG